jgi:predicted transcriptional regulator
MATDNNLRVSDELRAQAAEIAERQGRTTDEFAAEALAQYIETQKIAQDLSDLASWGARHARERGFKPSDVEHAIADVRRGR